MASEMWATYSPEDNKLRLYSMAKFGDETYKRVRAAGFIWAPKQELFVAPSWSPSREDLLIELCGEIGDEDTSLVERAEQRAERFEQYAENRKADAESAHKAVESITSGIPLGQPILVGHHSEKRARKDAERIQNGMQKAVDCWKQSKYWKGRAASAVRAAKYKERPEVRARRIKGLGTDLRREQKTLSTHRILLAQWQVPGLEPRKALALASMSFISRPFPLAEYPRPEGASKYEGDMSLWSALNDGIITQQQAIDIALPVHRGIIASAERWIEHISNRLEYENAMLAEDGATELLKPKPRRELLPLCNYHAPDGLTISRFDGGGGVEFHKQAEMTQAEYAKIHADYKGTRVVGNSHRVRVAIVNHSLVPVFLTDAKIHVPPAPKEPTPRELPVRTPAPLIVKEKDADAEKFEAMQTQLRAGVKVAVVNQLFETPRELAARMVELAGVQTGDRVLEPSAGNGRIVDALDDVVGIKVVAVEVNHSLGDNLKLRCNAERTDVRLADFLKCNGDLGKFDRILMNPPFENADDVKHIEHAANFLKPGGRLVAICANGPRQNDKLKPMADTWEPLPAGTFKESGTGVNTVLMVINR